MSRTDLDSRSSRGHPGPGYVDRKRLAWLLSLAVPLVIAASPLLWMWQPATWSLWLPVVFFYLIFPLIDLLLGTDTSNPPESAVPALEADTYYRHITFALVPLLWLAFIFRGLVQPACGAHTRGVRGPGALERGHWRLLHQPGP